MYTYADFYRGAARSKVDIISHVTHVSRFHIVTAVLLDGQGLHSNAAL